MLAEVRSGWSASAVGSNCRIGETGNGVVGGLYGKEWDNKEGIEKQEFSILKDTIAIIVAV